MMMKKFFAAALLATTIMTTVAFADDIPVNRVILSTSGLANFEHSAKVNGDGQLEFPVRFEQVDDILKSLVVFDKKGRLGGVTLPGKQPLAQVFKDLPFSKAQLSQPMMLLNSYQGAVVSVKTSTGTVTGKILHVDPFNVVIGDNKSEVKNRLSLMTDAGMKQVVLEDAQSLQFDDAKVKAEIARALDAIRENGTAERRILTVNLKGEGQRDVTLSYVVDAPLWKSAYRMVVPENGKDKGLLQGWAVIENMTAADWKNVDLTLVSGNPVTFRQSLYQSYYVDRPEIPVQVFGRVMPRVDNGAVGTAERMERDKDASAADPLEEWRRRTEMNRATMGGSAAEVVPTVQPIRPQLKAIGDASVAYMPAPMAAVAENGSMMGDVAQVANAAQSAEATTQVLFRFPDRFDLKSGQSMMVPFVSREVPMEKVSLYQPEASATHPLAAVEMTNDGDSGIPPGVLTLYEESSLLKGTAFVGDAQMPVLGQGEKRLISYALDSKTTISREDKSVSSEGKISISQGVIRTAVKNRSETIYTIKAPAKEDRVVIIEHPKMYDYKLVEPDPKGVDVSDERYRLRVVVKAGETKTFPVVLENETMQSYGIDSLPTDQLMTYAMSRGNLDPDTRKVFEELAQLRREMDAIDQQIYALDQKRQTIFSDQERVRENLKSLSGKSDVQQKYLDKLNAQEDDVAKIDAEKQKLLDSRSAKETEMKQKIAAMKF